MPHSREIRPHAYEVKFVVSMGLANEIRRWARIELEPDPHGGGPHGDEYRTTSLYLDNLTLDVLHRRGSMGRSKYRIRRYGAARQVFLERKLRQPAVLAKRRTIVPLASLGQLSPSLATVVPAFDRERTTIDGGWNGGWFHRRIAARGLRPVCQVSYVRMARGFFNGGETVRLTLDCELRARPALDFTFVEEPGMPIAGPLDGAAILELKYRGPAPAIFKHLVEEFALIPRSASKYRLGMQSALPSAARPDAPFCAAVRQSAKRAGGPTEFHA
jgi:hypothetical protein